MTAIRNCLRALRQIDTSRPLFELRSRCRRQYYGKITIKEDDVVLLRRKVADDSSPILTKPLQRTRKVETPRGFIEMGSIIGRGVRDVVLTNTNVKYRIHQPTLAEYIILSPRLVTPVYPAYANLIVSLLDLHPPAGPKNSDDEPLEIFEAGTGHGSLTLHLARAIHSFNQPPQPIPYFEALKQSSPINEITSHGFEKSTVTVDPNPEELASVEKLKLKAVLEGTATTESLDQRAAQKALDHRAVKEAYEAYLPTRRAVVQTLDISPKQSSHAERTIRQFHHGLYLHNINFHTGTIGEYLSSRLSSPATPQASPFLAHAILDLPAPQDHFDILSQALQPNGALIVFCPNITQIGKCVQLVAEKRMPFLLETVLEVAAGLGAGGRPWDVKVVKPRALLKAEAEAAAQAQAQAQTQAQIEAGSDFMNGNGNGNGNGRDDVLDGEEPAQDDAVVESRRNADDGWEMICRPKAGGYVPVGGFVALWRRMSWEGRGR